MRFAFALAVAAVSGFVALSYEILWYRVISYASWGLPGAFGLLLAAYLFGTTIQTFPSPFPDTAWRNNYVGSHEIGVIHDAGPRKGRPARMRRAFPDAARSSGGCSTVPSPLLVIWAVVSVIGCVSESVELACSTWNRTFLFAVTGAETV